MKLDDILEESLNRPVPWEYQGKAGTMYKYSFVSKSILYQAQFYTYSPYDFESLVNHFGMGPGVQNELGDDITINNTMVFDFEALKDIKTDYRILNGFDASGIGDATEVLSTILDIIKDARKRLKLKFLSFDAHGKRGRIYERLINRLAKGRYYHHHRTHLVEL